MKVHAADTTLNRVQDAQIEAFRPLTTNELLDGHLLKSVALASGSNLIAHRLDRAPVGWIIVRRNGAATVHELAVDSRHLTLSASAAVTVDLYVF
jgi:hypothetical protein